MDPARWQLVDELFARVADLTAEERAPLLAAAPEDIRAEVESLLASDAAAAGAIGKKVAGGVQLLNQGAAAQAGPYVLKEELGRGGMGAVFRGERADGQYTGAVAVKLLRPGFETGMFLERFRRERQALARLVHPNIARLLDSGSCADGTPYIVMELVDGEPIHTFCSQRSLNANQILELFLPVCRAVAHAHQRLIVHRDLKPGNILVTADGVPKLLDFGICKTLDDMDPEVTATGEHLLTPDYASPEQIRGEPITPASDVYSLGAVLYRLLTGRSPHQIEKYNALGVAHAVCEVEPDKPGIAVDIDTIILKALQKDPNRRYASAEQLAEDIRRALSNEPVLARPDTIVYRSTKFVRRHPWGVAAGVCAAVGLTVGLIAYARQASIARQEAAEARRVANALIFDIHDKVRGLPGSLSARLEIIRLGMTHLDRLVPSAASDPALRKELAAAYFKLGDVQGDSLGASAGDSESALASYRKGIAVLGDPGADVAASVLFIDLTSQVAYLISSRDSAAATQAMEPAIAAARRLPAPATLPADAQFTLARAYVRASLLFRRDDRSAQTESIAAEAATILRGLLARNAGGPDAPLLLANALTVQGTIALRQNDPKKARDIFEEAIRNHLLAYEKKKDVEILRNLTLAHGHLGDALANPGFTNLGDAPGASRAFDTMLRYARELHEKNPGDQVSLIDYGMALGRVASLPIRPGAERLALFAESRAKLVEALRRDGANRVVRLNSASYERFAGELAEAEKRNPIPHYDYALAALAEKRVQGSAIIAADVHRRAGLYLARRGDVSGARRHAADALHLAESETGKSILDAFASCRANAAAGLIAKELRDPNFRASLEKAIAAAKSLENQPGFISPYRTELRQWEQTLAAQESK